MNFHHRDTEKSSGFTRREILAAFLGLPVALAACQHEAPRFPDGEIVGASDRVGHRLRDRINIAPPQDRWESVKVVIVGAGIAGLAAARKFLKAGFTDFIVLELEPVAGGTSRGGESQIVPYPWGAHYIPVPLKENRELVELFDEMGLLEGRAQDGAPIVAEQYLCRDPEERIFYRGRWYEGLYLYAGASEEDLDQFKRFQAEIDQWVVWRDARGRRAFTLPVAESSDDAELTALDQITMSDWMNRRGFSSARLRWLVDYSCRDDYGMTIDQTSAWAGLFYFASRVEKPGQEAQSLVTWPDGNARLVSYLYKATADRVRLGWAVADINPVDNARGGGVDIVAIDHGGNNTFGIHAQKVIFCAPQFLTNYLIRPYREQPPAHVAEFQYGAWMVANLTLKDRPHSLGFPLAWDNVLYESPSLGYVVATHQRGLDRGPTIFTYYYPLCDDDPKAARNRLLSTDWRGWTDVVLTDLNRAHNNIRSVVERVDLMRWGHAMIRPRPGFIWSGARTAAARPFRGIHFAHSDLSGVALFEEAFYQGSRAAREILSEMRGGIL